MRLLGSILSFAFLPQNFVLATGFYNMIFFGLLFSGGVPPVQLKNIYALAPLACFVQRFVVTQ
jgi:hypothetical protein